MITYVCQPYIISTLHEAYGDSHMTLHLPLLPHHCHLVHEGDRDEEIGQVDVGATDQTEPRVAVIKWVTSHQVQRGVECAWVSEAVGVVDLPHLRHPLPVEIVH